MDPLEEIVRAQPGLSIALAILGLIVGSFLNVVIHRLPKMMERQWERDSAEFRGEDIPETTPYSLAFPGSHCPSCKVGDYSASKYSGGQLSALARSLC